MKCVITEVETKTANFAVPLSREMYKKIAKVRDAYDTEQYEEMKKQLKTKNEALSEETLNGLVKAIYRKPSRRHIVYLAEEKNERVLQLFKEL